MSVPVPRFLDLIGGKDVWPYLPGPYGSTQDATRSANGR